jgi:hypothetical protein
MTDESSELQGAALVDAVWSQRFLECNKTKPIINNHHFIIFFGYGTTTLYIQTNTPRSSGNMSNGLGGGVKYFVCSIGGLSSRLILLVFGCIETTKHSVRM